MEARIHIVGPIGTIEDEQGREEVGVELIDVVSQVSLQKGATSYRVHIDSPGGVVETGDDIYDYLKKLAKKFPVKTVGSNMVASIATKIFMAGTTREVLKGCQFMIHLPMGGIQWATADEMEAHAAQVRVVETKMIKFYCDVTGLEAEAIRPILRNETWLTPEQLKNFGFITAEAPVQIVARASIINNKKPKKNKMGKKKKKTSVLKMFKSLLKEAQQGIITNLILLTADQVEVDFYELEEGQDIAVGAKARVNGSDATGTLTMADGRKVTFEAGAVSTIEEATEDEDDTEMAAKLAAAEAEVLSLKKDKSRLTKSVSNLKASQKKTAKAVKKIKKLKSKFAEQDPKATRGNRTGNKKGKKTAFSTALANIQKQKK